MQQQTAGTNGNPRRVRNIRIVIALFVTLVIVFAVGITHQSHKQQTWMWTLPVQCFDNPWEVAWLESHDPETDSFPSSRDGMSTELVELIIDYYATQNIEVLDVRIEGWGGNYGICLACSCPRGDTLYLLVNNTEVEKLYALGYAEVRTEPTQNQQIRSLKRILDEIPAPDQSIFVHEAYRGSVLCNQSSAGRLYATDATREELLAYYRDWLDKSDWTFDNEWEGTTQRSISGHIKYLGTSTQHVSFFVLMDLSSEAGSYWYTPNEAGEIAKASGETVFTISIGVNQQVG